MGTEDPVDWIWPTGDGVLAVPCNGKTLAGVPLNLYEPGCGGRAAAGSITFKMADSGAAAIFPSV